MYYSIILNQCQGFDISLIKYVILFTKFEGLITARIKYIN